ncbi:auxin-responsive protein IAA26-like [Camellia sinensis]|uniref:auxin-responsive protein IAA26-like n=1 Tax=Camellia sinensis TaxID=4442 RepID=UPI001036438B|nr:auxin-responsive protein IAA26-like [Camellia sinensis]XP_028123717.1 auxin-responsive protein IAA26-like [Camellia sinensis]
MEGCSNKDEVACPQLLDLIPKDREWLLQRDEQGSHGYSEEKKLELRLGPPGEGDWTIKNGTDQNNSTEREREDSILSLGYFSNMKTVENSWIMNNNGNQNHKFSFSENPIGITALSSPSWSSSTFHAIQTQQQQRQQQQQFLQLQSNPHGLPVMAKESSQPCHSKPVDLQNAAEKKAFSPASANTAVPNSSQKRTAPASVVGWPPIRSFRKNLASSCSSKPTSESQNLVPIEVPNHKLVESCRKDFFVKINMDGVPIGRKVDLKAYDSYEKLSSAVDDLFRGLLAAQRDSSPGGIENKQEAEKAITGLLDGSGEYTLVYEDNEGDRILVGDVPWHMFVSTVKRLRVLKSSELSTLCLGSKKEMIQVDVGSK